MRAGLAWADDICNQQAAHQKRIAHQRAVAAPGNGLGAHDRAGLLASQLDQPVNALGKGLSLHVIGIVAEGLHPPALVDRVLGFRPQPAQFLQVDVFDAICRQGLLQGALLVLGVIARARHGADVDQPCHAIFVQQPEEFLDRPRGMPDGENSYYFHGFISPLPFSVVGY